MSEPPEGTNNSRPDVHRREAQPGQEVPPSIEELLARETLRSRRPTLPPPSGGTSRLILEGWFLHIENVLKLLGTARATQATTGLPPLTSPYGQAYWSNAVEQALAHYLETVGVEALAAASKHETIAKGRLVWVDQAFYFKGLAKARDKGGRATFAGSLDTDPSIRVIGDFNAARVMSSTGLIALTGRSRQFVLGFVTDLQPESVTLRPLFMGQRYMRPDGDAERDLAVGDAARLWPMDIDAFAAVDFSRSVTASELKLLRGVPEHQVKTWFAEILGEPDVPNDWGGEQFDLWTSRVNVRGEPHRTAIAFKGPAAFRPMTISHLGKNGDQIDRLFATSADLMIVQHCHRITAPVDNMLRTYATHPNNARRYMTIDGYQTLAILRHFGYLGESR